MLQLAIIALAILGMIWNTDPLLRPYVDAQGNRVKKFMRS
jgi:hypothetical protein